MANSASNRFLQLLQGFLAQRLSDSEITEFFSLLNMHENQELLGHDVIQNLRNNKFTGLSSQPQLQQAYEKLAAQLQTEPAAVRSLPTTDHQQSFNWRRLAIAASILIAVSFGIYALVGVLANKSGDPAVVGGLTNNDVPAPDKNRAQIKLADGSIVYLDSVANGELVNTNGVQVTKTADGKIVYSPLTTHDSPLTISYNTLTNPRGSIVLNITLSDGSHVWLNAGSSITYPVAFTGNQRKITMTGEGYFEVAKDAKKKFIVSANGTTTEVLGTHFNINAYDDESDIKVTLIEGSVKVGTSLRGTKQSILKPGQQAVLSTGGRPGTAGREGSPFTIHHSPDLEQVMAWKNGQFSFVNTNLKTVMKQIARWYDVEIVYEGQVPDEEFNGGTSRQENVSGVLKVLEATGKIKFRVEGKKVIVSK